MINSGLVVIVQTALVDYGQRLFRALLVRWEPNLRFVGGERSFSDGLKLISKEELNQCAVSSQFGLGGVFLTKRFRGITA